MGMTCYKVVPKKFILRLVKDFNLRQDMDKFQLVRSLIDLLTTLRKKSIMGLSQNS
jgi:hypothetical protein